MALLGTCRNFNKTINLLHKFSRNARKILRLDHAVLARTYSSLNTSQDIKKVVYVSNSKNIFENLALEEWLYENIDMKETDYLLMWRNGPAVVVGRHQNPWLECDVQEAIKRGILVARRSSGGGTVYHDEGNMNLSFLMHRSRYDRRKNLSLVVAAVTSHWDLDLDLNCRDDLVLDGVYKVSGTASKLGGNRTYHHFTLVFDVDGDTMSSILHSSLLGADSKATKSLPSPVKNLSEYAPDMTFDSLVEVIGQHFMKTEKDKRFTVINPTDETRFPGISHIRQRLSSWDWVFSKTPSFSITRTFVKSLQESNTPYCRYSLKTSVTVDKGKLRNVSSTLYGQLRENRTDVELPFRLLDFLDSEGVSVEVSGLNDLWEKCEKKMREEDDYELLMWGLECMKKCVPAGHGDSIKS